MRLGEEVREIRERLRLAERRDDFVVEQEWAVRVTDLQAHLLRHQPHIVHFSGHGSKAGQIILEDHAGQIKPIAQDALKSLFATLKDNIRCVVLNACYSEAQAEGIAESIACVVGMGRAINDNSAIAFAASFYQGLGYGRSIQTAFDLGTGQIDLQGLSGKDVPQLKVAPGVDPASIFLAGGGARTSSGPHGTPRSAKETAKTPKPSGESAEPADSEHYSFVIIYSPEDEEFAKHLHSQALDAGLRVWFAPDDLKGGHKILDQITQAINDHDKLLLVLSEASMGSGWVETALRKALQREEREDRQMLFPIRITSLDRVKGWKCFDSDTGKDMAVEIREYFIPDFTRWNEPVAFEAALERLLKDLRAEESTESKLG